MRIRKKTFILIITYFTAAVTALGAYACVQCARNTAYARSVGYGYGHAFEEVVLSVSNLDSALKRGSYAKGSEISMQICGEIYSNCLAAEMTMGVLPFSSYELEKTASFLGICGDYAASLMKTCAAKGFTDAEREKLSELSETAGTLKESLEKLQSDVNDGTALMDAPGEPYFEGDESSLVSSRMKAFEEDFGELPELSYDGVYAKAEKSAPDKTVSEDEALASAREFTGRSDLQLEFAGENGSYCFGFEGGSVMVNAAGEVMSFSQNRSVAGDMSDEELIAKAEELLKNAGYPDMRLLSTYRINSVLTASYAPESSDGVLLDTEKVTVSVAADNGELYAFNATDYLENHGVVLTKPEITQEEAQLALPDTLTVTDCRLTLCPTYTSERLCYDFGCVSPDGDELRILVDASSGRQFEVVLK